MRWKGGLLVVVAALLLHGCGSENNKVASEDANLKRCQAACTNLCLDPYCSPCSVDACVNTCTAFTAGLETVCAQCVATNISYGDGYTDAGKICVATFKSTASPECAPACIGGGDAGR
jgi:hypothetical protein